MPHFSRALREVGLLPCRYSDFAVLEPELRTKRYPQVIMSAVIEKDIIANFCPHSDRTGKGFNTAAGIEREIRRAIRQPNLVDETRRGILIVDAEIIKSNFAGDEKANGPRACLEFRTEKSV